MKFLPAAEEIAQAEHTLAGMMACPGTVTVDPAFTWELRKMQQSVHQFGMQLETDRQEQSLYAPRIAGADHVRRY